MLKNWLPNVIQSVKPYFTPHIDKGRRWSHDIAEKLDKCSFGLILLTKDNLKSDWILFEAGALSKHVGDGQVCPILLGLTPADITGPLSQFQSTQIDKQDFYKLIVSINNSLSENQLSDSTLKQVFEKWWPDLEKDINSVLDSDNDGGKKHARSERELLEEVLRLVRLKAMPRMETGSSLERFNRKSVVTFDDRTKTINVWFEFKSPYQISIESVDSGAKIADWLFQLNGKGACRPEHLQEFLNCIEDLSHLYFSNNAQGVFCPMGENKLVKWPF